MHHEKKSLRREKKQKQNTNQSVDTMTYNLSKKKKRAFTLNTYHVSVYKTILKVHKQRLKEPGRENKGPQPPGTLSSTREQWSVQTLLKKGGVLSIR